MDHDTGTGPRVELLLSTIDEESQTFPNSQELLLDPNISIGDTAATVHMSPHEKGMTNNVKKIHGGITVGNGEVMVAKKVGDIPCEICGKPGTFCRQQRYRKSHLPKVPLLIYSALLK